MTTNDGRRPNDGEAYIIDRWGLFNPPGVGPFDKDPDDDIPFRGFDEESEG